jgi:hypothetical protein
MNSEDASAHAALCVLIATAFKAANVLAVGDRTRFRAEAMAVEADVRHVSRALAKYLPAADAAVVAKVKAGMAGVGGKRK